VSRTFSEEREFMLATILRDVPEKGTVKRQTLREMFSNVFTLGYQLGEANTTDRAAQAFETAYSEYTEPLVGVMYGLKAIRNLPKIAPGRERKD
jgi:hypothetical protein